MAGERLVPSLVGSLKELEGGQEGIRGLSSSRQS